ncbi:hypothetical protein GGH14_004810 [Coemansia sp. RSA 370]|nr:hypothetical protein GGH14_004810 [Coemansia sp. RSA 370]
MVSFSALAASVLAFTSAVHAGFYTTYPIGSDALQAGQNIQITWRTDDQAPDLTNVGSYTLKFMTGGNFVQTTVATIGTFDVAQKTVSFTVPNTAPGMYFLMYTAEGSAGSSWSTRFSVGGGTTWYPEGVATGKDDDDKTSSPVEPSSSSVEPSSSPAEPSSSPAEQSSSSSTKPGGIGEATDISAESSSTSSSSSDSSDTTKPTDDPSTGNTSKPAPTDDTTSGNSDTSDNQTDGGDNTDDSSPANTSDANTDVSSPAGSDAPDNDSDLGSESDDEQVSDDDRSADDKSSDDKKSSSKEKSSSEDDEEDEDSDSSAGSMSRLLSGAAVLAASIFMI